MSKENYHKRESKNVKALFSVVCLCIVALGLIVYFTAANGRVEKNDAVNENQTLEVTSELTTEVQRAVTVKETTQPEQTARETSSEDESTAKKQKKKEAVTMEQGDNNTPYKSYYKYPISEAIVKGYSEELVYDETMGDYRAHAAVDFKGAEGDKVTAINDGIVLNAYVDNMLGGVVEIDHGGKLVVKYCGLKSISVKKGKRLDIGNTIGALGAVPSEEKEEAHLHLEARIDGALVNPLDVMGKTE